MEKERLDQKTWTLNLLKVLFISRTISYRWILYCRVKLYIRRVTNFLHCAFNAFHKFLAFTYHYQSELLFFFCMLTTLRIFSKSNLSQISFGTGMHNVRFVLLLFVHPNSRENEKTKIWSLNKYPEVSVVRMYSFF